MKVPPISQVGLEMKGSDFDYMIVLKMFRVHEHISEIKLDPFQIYFTISTDDTKLGFVRLQLLYSQHKKVVQQCVASNGNLYLSNQLVKSFLKLNMRLSTLTNFATEVDHGPCLSDKEGLYDFAICLHQNTWISLANHWITRPNLSWPCDDVKSKIIDHGVLYVPVGVKGSPSEEIEWRLSFSVGEKLLINSFNHTQLLCYALMKIALKDIINEDERCKDLLCSYYIKNIMFWVSEEFSISTWKPYNLLFCFMQCFKRLIYCVEYSICPHYFIPENNMFENKIEGYSRTVLLDKLNALFGMNWKFILFSSQLKDFLETSCIPKTKSESFIRNVELMNLSSAVLCYTTGPSINHYYRCVEMIVSCRLPTIKSYHKSYFSKLSKGRAETVEFTGRDSNRHMYKNYKLCQSHLLPNLHQDVASGWLQLASLFYRIKQYRKASDILSYALSKCSLEKISKLSKLSCPQREFLKSGIIQSKGLVSILQFLRLDEFQFNMRSTLIPRELELEICGTSHSIPSVVYAHFLSFLCHFHLGDDTQTKASLRNLQRTIFEDYFIFNANGKSKSLNCLGIALQLIGDKRLSHRAFCFAFLLDPMRIWSNAFVRLCNSLKLDRKTISLALLSNGALPM